MGGVEPTCLAALDPKSSASANFATSALFILQSYDFFTNLNSKIYLYYFDRNEIPEIQAEERFLNLPLYHQ